MNQKSENISALKVTGIRKLTEITKLKIKLAIFSKSNIKTVYGKKYVSQFSV